jgi:malate synthase
MTSGPNLTPHADDRTQEGAPARVVGPALPWLSSVLTPEALAFIADLARTFGERREALLTRRKEVQAALDSG